MINVTIGTAGHVDHGKTELVKLLTGCDTDRLPEEKARGMSIDLGFALCNLPGRHRVGIVDVPGHERFLHNMVAGAAGIDAVLLVVAADDGVMPQTIEHLQILTLLGTTRGLVAVTKVDLVSGQRRAEVCAQVRDLLADSPLAGASVVEVSARTGEGFEGFYEAFSAMVLAVPKRLVSGVFRVHIERTFTVKGRGVVATGIPRSGAVRPGDRVVLLPGGEEKRIRGVQVFGRDVEVGRAGECVALNVAGLGSKEAGRGMALAAPGYYSSAECVNFRLNLLEGVQSRIVNRMEVRFFVGTSATPGRLLLPSTLPAAGEPLYAQVQLDSDVVAAPGDFCLVRGLSPVMTVGGGRVVSMGHRRLRRLRESFVSGCRLAEEALASPAASMTQILAGRGLSPAGSAELGRCALVPEGDARKILAEMVASGAAEQVGQGYLLSRLVRDFERELLARLTKLHARHPIVHEFRLADLAEHLTDEQPVAEAALERLVAEGAMEKSGDGFRLPGREPQLSPKQTELAASIINLCREVPFRPPPVAKIRERTGMEADLIDPVVDYLVREGDLVRISDAIVMPRESLDQAEQVLRSYLDEHSSIQSATCKELLDTNRRYSFAILEYWDARGLTRREGNRRFLLDACGPGPVD